MTGHKELVEKAKKVSRAVYLAAEESTATDISKTILALVDTIERLEQEKASTELHLSAWKDSARIALHRAEAAEARNARLTEALQPMIFALETTDACLKLWNNGRGGPADTDGILRRARAALSPQEGS